MTVLILNLSDTAD